MCALHGAGVKTDGPEIPQLFSCLWDIVPFLSPNCLPLGSGSRWNPNFLLIGLETKINFRSAGLKKTTCTGFSTTGSYHGREAEYSRSDAVGMT